MRRFLTAEGFDVATASSGEEGVRLARRLLPLAITLGVMMPGMDGWTVLSTLKADPQVSGIPVVMLTMLDDKQRGYARRAENYMTKPVDRTKLARILRELNCQDGNSPILLVRGDPDSREPMRAILKSEGCGLQEAENGAAALQIMSTMVPGAVLVDLHSDEEDGYSFAAEMRQNPVWQSIPTVALTSGELTNEDLRRLNGTVHAIIDKSVISGDDLLRQVHSIVSKWASIGNSTAS